MNVFVFGKTMSDVFLKSNTVVAQLSNWFCSNKLSLNVRKHVTVFSDIDQVIFVNNVFNEMIHC